MKPVVIFDKGQANVVGSSWRTTRDYRKYRADVSAAAQYRDVVALLESALLDRGRRLSVALDFAPSADYARRFISTTGLYRTKPLGSVERKLADRAIRVLIYLLTSGGSRPTGRPVGKILDADDRARVRDAVDEWLRLVRPVWMASHPPRKIASAIHAADDKHRLSWSVAHHAELNRLASRRSSRPSTLAIQLAAWQLGLSVHQVRRCRQRQPDFIHA